MRSASRKYFVLAGVTAIVVFAGAEVAKVAATCSLGFTPSQPTCTVADASQNFSYITEVSWASQGKCSWTILFSLGNPGGGISNHQKNINSVGVTDNCGFNGGVIQCTVTGHRDSGTPTSSLNVIEQDDTPECSGGRNVTVLGSGSC
jgi:hypothetical protein